MPKNKAKPNSGGKGAASGPVKIALDSKVTLVRRLIKDKKGNPITNGKITGRRPGRPGPNYEIGFLVDNQYYPGNPPTKKRPVPKMQQMKIIPAPPAKMAGYKRDWSGKGKKLGIESIIDIDRFDRLVEERVNARVDKIVREVLVQKFGTAKAAAMSALSHALQI